MMLSISIVDRTTVFTAKSLDSFMHPLHPLPSPSLSPPSLSPIRSLLPPLPLPSHFSPSRMHEMLLFRSRGRVCLDAIPHSCCGKFEFLVFIHSSFSFINLSWFHQPPFPQVSFRYRQRGSLECLSLLFSTIITRSVFIFFSWGKKNPATKLAIYFFLLGFFTIFFSFFVSCVTQRFTYAFFSKS